MSGSSVWFVPHEVDDPPYKHVPQPINRRKEVNLHNLQKRELYDQTNDINLGQAISLSGFQYVTRKGLDIEEETLDEDEHLLRDEHEKVDRLSRQITPKFGIQDTYVYLDTDTKDTSSNLALGEYAFNVSSLNKNNPISNVIEMEISNFFFPDILTNAWEPVYFFYKELTINIKEMDVQSIRAQNSVRAHFIMDVRTAGISNFAEPKANGGKFIFDRPFRDVNIVTLQFRAPIKTVEFEQDIYTFETIPASNPGRITLVDPINLPAASEVSIFIRNVATDIGSLDATLNSKEGHLVTVIDQNTLEFAAGSGIDFTAVPATPGDFTVGFRRIGIAMRFRSITTTETNFIVPV